MNIILHYYLILYILLYLYDSNIRLRIENEKDILFSLSSTFFYDLSMIAYDTNIIIKQFEKILNIKFNTSNYESKIEYNIMIFENNNNFKNITNYLYHEIINNKSFIYKNIISSIGIDPISIDINIDKFLSYEKKYITFILGKEYFENSFHYIYYDPKEFIVINNKNKNDNRSQCWN